MRRWNGWGDTTIDYPLPHNALAILQNWVGPAIPPHDVTFAEVVTAVPDSRLPEHPLISRDAEDRLRHARGQSLPDLIAMRSGRIRAFPDGVAFPASDEDVVSLITYAGKHGFRLIPYGGGTSVVGHINPDPGESPVITVDLQRMNRLRHFDEISQLAAFGAGVRGPDLEAQLRAQGYTLGHFPQSFELSTLGGWVATRSSGQQSLGYGRIENLFAGGTLQSPAGKLVLPPFPASAAGPDIREMVLGSEGRLGIITEAVMRVSPLPERDDVHAVFFPDFAAGQAAVRHIVQARLPLSMIRLSTAVETQTTLALAGRERLVGTLEKLLAVRGIKEAKCMLLLGFTGTKEVTKTSRKEALGLCGKFKGVHVGRQFGKQWQKGRFRTPYLRNSLWEVGYAVDTLETAVSWSHVSEMMAAIEAALTETAAAFNEKIHVFTHLSHVYPTGASIYTTYLFRLAADPDETLERWRKMKTAVSQAIVAHEGTISHQHGVGTDHAPFLIAEKGDLGMAAITDLTRRFDPRGIMNPGKLIGNR